MTTTQFIRNRASRRLPLLICQAFFFFLLIPVDAEEAELPSYLFQVFLIDDVDYSKSMQSTPATELQFESGGEVFTLQAQAHGLSPLFTYRGSPRLQFFRQTNGQQNEVFRQLLVEVDLGKPGRRIIFIRKRSNGKLYSSVIKMDPEYFRKNHLRIQNLSSHVIRAGVSDQVETLPSLGGHNFKVDIEEGLPVVDLRMAAYDGQEAYVVEKKKYVFRRGNRKMILLYNDLNKDGRVQYNSILIRDAPEKVVNLSQEKVAPRDLSGYYTDQGMKPGETEEGP